MVSDSLGRQYKPCVDSDIRPSNAPTEVLGTLYFVYVYTEVIQTYGLLLLLVMLLFMFLRL